ncbi:uncharacterized protein LOC115217580 [Octopus sinensis]|uniref:Uncharacterized protein LOC115217580 n=1 Tax=Octopus sinensis TaxID=2607531 RepID=A0A7E6F8G1_9MOLL|nr:uncharacterized protein LOC115217580 [Octopus sinensis]
MKEQIPDLRKREVRDQQLFTAIEKIQEEQSQQGEMLQSILQLIQNIPSSSSISETRNLPNIIHIPCESQDVETLEAELSDGVVQNNMVNYLAMLRGKNTSDTEQGHYTTS